MNFKSKGATLLSCIYFGFAAFEVGTSEGQIAVASGHNDG